MIVAKHFLPPGIIQSNYITSRFSKKRNCHHAGFDRLNQSFCRGFSNKKKGPPRIGTAFFFKGLSGRRLLFGIG
jgi:hypothetical protein